MEYCSNGNLRQFLRNSRNVYNVDEQILTTDFSQNIGPKNLIQLAWQIAKGMTFLISRKVRALINNFFTQHAVFYFEMLFLLAMATGFGSYL